VFYFTCNHGILSQQHINIFSLLATNTKVSDVYQGKMFNV